MSPAPAKIRKAPTRSVFCRLTVEIEGKPIRFELHRDGLHVRRKHSRRVRILTFPDLQATAIGQKLLPL